MLSVFNLIHNLNKSLNKLVLSTSCRRFNAGVVRVAVFMSNGYGIKLVLLSNNVLGVLLITAGVGRSFH